MTRFASPSRSVMRTLHLVFALVLGAAVYAPMDVVPTIRPIFQWVVLPLTATTGLWMWLGHRLAGRARRFSAVSTTST